MVDEKRSSTSNSSPAATSSSAGSIRVLLADDHNVFREGLRALLQKQTDIEIIGEASDGATTIEQTYQLTPDVVIMDISMPDLNGVDATRNIRQEKPKTRVLCLSVHREGGYVQAMLEAGAAGYLLKTTFSKEVVSAVRTVARGETYLSPQVANMVVQNNIRDNADKRAITTYSDLTERERQILQLIAEGRDCKEVAQRLSITHKTVLRHRDKIMQKVGHYSDAALTRYALEEGIVDL